MTRAAHPNIAEQEIERRLALRVARQQLLTQPGAPYFWAIIDEAALWRAGGCLPIHNQIQHLLEMAELPNITIQTIPFHSSAYAAAGGPFTILQFTAAELPDIVYLEQLTNALYLDKDQDVNRYLSVMNRLCVEAATPTETIRFLNKTLKES